MAVSTGTNHSAAPVASEATRAALLEAGGAVFAERGFRAATVREICQRAGANIAAVNYHFGDKEQLYREVLSHFQTRAHEKFPPDLGLRPGATPEQRLAAFVRSFLLRIFDPGSDAWHGKLISREMIEPTSALDDIVVEKIRPQAEWLGRIIRDLIGPGADPETVRLCSFSVVSQCLFYHHCQPVLCRLFPEQKYDAEDLEQLTAHITSFCLTAIGRLARVANARRRKERTTAPARRRSRPERARARTR